MTDEQIEQKALDHAFDTRDEPISTQAFRSFIAGAKWHRDKSVFPDGFSDYHICRDGKLTEYGGGLCSREPSRDSFSFYTTKEEIEKLRSLFNIIPKNQPGRVSVKNVFSEADSFAVLIPKVKQTGSDTYKNRIFRIFTTHSCKMITIPSVNSVKTFWSRLKCFLGFHSMGEWHHSGDPRWGFNSRECNKCDYSEDTL